MRVNNKGRWMEMVSSAYNQGFTTDQIADEVEAEYDSVLTRLRRYKRTMPEAAHLHALLTTRRQEELAERDVLRYEHPTRCVVGHWSKVPGPCTHGHRNKTKGGKA